MKLCKDCKHYTEDLMHPPRCGLTVSPVTGGPLEYCYHERLLNTGDRCGPGSVHFEARPARVSLLGRLGALLRVVNV
jgi:hypothetical protein